MRRVITPVLFALAFAAFTSANASAGLFGGHNKSCDACCPEPACGCEPTCGVAVAAPACGCEVACDSHCKKPGLLSRLFAKRSSCCDAPCCPPEPACGCEIVDPACGCEAPVCGCDSHCGPKRPGLLKRLFAKRNHCCDSAPCCEAPTCGCEPSCGF